MIGLSPVRVLIILIIGLILLGPHRLPEFSRQAGAAWHKLRDLQRRFESELRRNVPDLPDTSDIARYARSPISLLNTLADKAAAADETEYEAGDVESDPTGAGSTSEEPDHEVAGGATASQGYSPPDEPEEGPEPEERFRVGWGDPSLN